MAFLKLRDNRSLYYVEEGSGQPVVFVHGWKSKSDVYELPSYLLSRTKLYRCVRYDQCGHWRSELPSSKPSLKLLADDLHEVITQLGLKRPILVGWSMGGATVLEYLRQYGSDDIDRVVIVDMTPKMLNDNQWKLGFLCGTYTKEDLDRRLLEMRTDLLEYLRNYYSGIKPGFLELSREIQDTHIAERANGYNVDLLADLWESLCMADYCDSLTQIKCPTAIFYAGILPICMKEAASFYEAKIPAPVKVVCFENGTHALLTEYPEEFVEQLKLFFES